MKHFLQAHLVLVILLTGCSFFDGEIDSNSDRNSLDDTSPVTEMNTVAKHSETQVVGILEGENDFEEKDEEDPGNKNGSVAKKFGGRDSKKDDEQRRNDKSAIGHALSKFEADTDVLPETVPTDGITREICRSGADDCTNLIDLRILVEQGYLSELPDDPEVTDGNSTKYALKWIGNMVEIYYGSSIIVSNPSPVDPDALPQDEQLQLSVTLDEDIDTSDQEAVRAFVEEVWSKREMYDRPKVKVREFDYEGIFDSVISVSSVETIGAAWEDSHDAEKLLGRIDGNGDLLPYYAFKAFFIEGSIFILEGYELQSNIGSILVVDGEIVEQKVDEPFIPKEVCDSTGEHCEQSEAWVRVTINRSKEEIFWMNEIKEITFENGLKVRIFFRGIDDFQFSVFPPEEKADSSLSNEAEQNSPADEAANDEKQDLYQKQKEALLEAERVQALMPEEVQRVEDFVELYGDIIPQYLPEGLSLLSRRTLYKRINDIYICPSGNLESFLRVQRTPVSLIKEVHNLDNNASTQEWLEHYQKDAGQVTIVDISGNEGFLQKEIHRYEGHVQLAWQTANFYVEMQSGCSFSSEELLKIARSMLEKDAQKKL